MFGIFIIGMILVFGSHELSRSRPCVATIENKTLVWACAHEERVNPSGGLVAAGENVFAAVDVVRNVDGSRWVCTYRAGLRERTNIDCVFGDEK